MTTPSGIPAGPLTALESGQALSVAQGGTALASNVYAPGSQTLLTASTTTMAAFSSGVVCTGSFTAPPSGKVTVEASFVAQISAGGNKAGFALAAAGTVTPLAGGAITYVINTGSTAQPFALRFYVTGLTPGTSYNLDLLGCATSTCTVTIFAFGNTGTALGSAGGPVILTTTAA